MYTLPNLPYPYEALEPVIDAETMRIHHTKHHQTYVDKLNEALKEKSELLEKSVEDLLTDFDSLDDSIKKAVRNHGGGHANHSLFWKILQAPQEDNLPTGKIKEAIDTQFGSFAEFRDEFTKLALGVFGSGWTHLVSDQAGQLKLISTANQDSPILEGLKPILSLDVWEHAYYLKYQNRRPEYIDGFFSIINWSKVDEIFSI